MPELADHDEQISGFAARRRNDALPLARLTLPQPAHPAKNMPQRLAERLKSVASRFADAGKILEVLENFFGSLPILMAVLSFGSSQFAAGSTFDSLTFALRSAKASDKHSLPRQPTSSVCCKRFSFNKGSMLLSRAQMSLTI